MANRRGNLHQANNCRGFYQIGAKFLYFITYLFCALIYWEKIFIYNKKQFTQLIREHANQSL